MSLDIHWDWKYGRETRIEIENIGGLRPWKWEVLQYNPNVIDGMEWQSVEAGDWFSGPFERGYGRCRTELQAEKAARVFLAHRVAESSVGARKQAARNVIKIDFGIL